MWFAANLLFLDGVGVWFWLLCFVEVCVVCLCLFASLFVWLFGCLDVRAVGLLLLLLAVLVLVLVVTVPFESVGGSRLF